MKKSEDSTTSAGTTENPVGQEIIKVLDWVVRMEYAPMYEGKYPWGQKDDGGFFSGTSEAIYEMYKITSKLLNKLDAAQEGDATDDDSSKEAGTTKDPLSKETIPVEQFQDRVLKMIHENQEAIKWAKATKMPVKEVFETTNIFDAVIQTYEDLFAIVTNMLRAGQRPKIICYCGSIRVAKEAFQKAEYESLMRGEIALLPCCMFVDIQREFGAGSAYKLKADQQHKQKIDMADEVFILNVNGYIGESTRSEIDYALSIGKPVKYLEPPSSI
jgi:hypothetical protein